MSRPNFGRYKIAEEVGRGAMGVVYRALDPAIGRTVAVKSINESFIETVGVLASEYFERFRREAEVAGMLNHPHIVKIYDLGPNYIVMEFIEGQSLASMIRAKHHFPLSGILDIVGQVASALDYAHGHGIVHRDVKPANIMIQVDGSVKVMDFGLARIESSTLTAAGEILGSASYMAPEVVLGKPADARSDIFSLGVVAYEMMTGDRPFAGGSITSIIHSIVREVPRSAHAMNLNVPPEYDDIFLWVLAKDPGDRYSTATDFAQALVLKKWADRDPLLTESMKVGVTIPGVDTDAPTIMGGAPAAGAQTNAEAEEDAGAATMMTVDVDEMSPTAVPRPTAETQEIAAGEAEQAGKSKGPAPAQDDEEDDAPLAPLIGQTPRQMPVDVPTETQPADSAIPTLAREVAATSAKHRASSPTLVTEKPGPSAEPLPTVMMAATEAGATPPTTTSDAAGSPKKKGLSGGMMAAIGGGVLVLLCGVGGAGWFVVKKALDSRAVPAGETPAAENPADATPPPSEVLPTAAPPSAEPTPEPAEAAEAPGDTAPSTTMAAVPAVLSVTSEPSGARVVVGRRARGVTPLRLQLPAGKLTVGVEKDGFKPWKRDVTLAAGGTQTLAAQLEAVPKETPHPVAKATPPPTPAGVKAGDLVALTPDVTPPKKLSGDSPSIPRGAPKLKQTASVLVSYIVDENGSVIDPRIEESANDVLDKACTDAVKTWRYTPAVKDGVRVKVSLRARFMFQK